MGLIPGMAEAAASGGAWRWLIAGEWRAFPGRFLAAGLAIAIGVALAFAIHVINRSAADAFGEAVRSVSGEADLQVRDVGGLGFDEQLYPRLMALEGVFDASPGVELRATIGEGQVPITLLGLDMLRALGISPGLLGRGRQNARMQQGLSSPSMVDAAVDLEALYLSEAALSGHGLNFGDRVPVHVGSRTHIFTVAGDLPGVSAGQSVGLIDISAAQWRFERLGKIDRIDLKAAEGSSLRALRKSVEAVLPANARLTDVNSEFRRGDSLSRAYRVNLDMLALVALLTGGFLVYSTQSLSVTRRLRQFALIRTLGLQQSALRAQLLGEGLLMGIVGSIAGLGLGHLVATAALKFVGGDLGGGYFGDASPELHFAPAAALLYFAFGIAVAIAGSYAPARRAARIAPAEALKTAGDPIDPRIRPRWLPALSLVVAGAATALLPAVGRLPIFGYLSVALVLAGGIAAMPWLAGMLLRPMARINTRLPSVELALQRLLGSPSQAAIALGGIVASTGLMIAMAVMVTSFRGSVDDWLQSFLSADLYVAAASSEQSFDAAAQNRLAGTPGIATIAFSKSVPLTLDPKLPPLLLIVRPVGGTGYTLPLIGKPTRRGEGVPLWFSEPAARLYRAERRAAFQLPIGRTGKPVTGHVAGIWRDYARQQGAIVIDSRDYVALTGDELRSEAAIELAPGASAASVRAAIEQRLPPAVAGRIDFAEPGDLKRRALALFDRSFAITYVLEAVAILIGLAGVAATTSAQTIARAQEFGMLRHIGMTRRQIILMLAVEGALLGLIGIAAGCTVGLGLSQILIHVINPQSFNWTMTTHIPLGLMIAVAGALVVTSSATAAFSGRRAVSQDAVRAVSEDW